MYYIIVNGSQMGPMPKEALRNYGVTAQTPVWRSGLQDWTTIGQLPELADLLDDGSAFGAYTMPEQPAPPQQQYGPYNGYNPYNQQPQFQSNHRNWQPLAIVGTICGALFSCIGMIFGIIGWVNANKANNCYRVGQFEMGDSANKTAKNMTIISLVISAIGILIFAIKGPAMIMEIIDMYN